MAILSATHSALTIPALISGTPIQVNTCRHLEQRQLKLIHPSLSGLQRADGVAGALIIREGRADPHRTIYDTDWITHEILITDWLHAPANSKFVFHHHGSGDNKPRSLLINGRGRFGNYTFMSNFSTPVVPLANFTLIPGLRHRFRLINYGFLNCPMELSIDNHTLLVIASDGEELQPIEVDSLVSYAGERFDFVVTANQTPGSYWLRVRGLMDCDERFNAVHQVAIVLYEGSEKSEPLEALGYQYAARGGKQLNPLNVGSNDGISDTITMAEVLSLKSGEISLLKAQAKHTFYLGYDFYKKDNPTFHRPQLYGFHQVVQNTERLQTPQLNHISLKLPGSPMILQNEASLAPLFCNQSSLAQQGRDCKKEFCHCLHRIRVEVNDIVDLVLIDEGNAFDANHPFHLHGHAFHVMTMQKLGRNTSIESIRDLLQSEQNYLSQPRLHAPLKDTITVPDGGFTKLRLNASNPGVWLFHCHIGFHIEIGMGFVLQVGDWSEFIETPKGFPTCGDWLPSLGPQPYSKEEENQVVLLQPNNSSEHVIYHLLQNITQQLRQPTTPPVVVVQHMWPSDWWTRHPNNKARLTTMASTMLLFVSLLTHNL
ncbi:hypothetical protein B566_EDAN010799 [Ephemera danica]|nr:hypothetical protein B566_EDAN010799 [Ephemera danica]